MECSAISVGGYPIPEGAVGKDPQYNNTSGFNGFPAGIRGIDGTFSGIGYTVYGIVQAAHLIVGFFCYTTVV